MKLSIIAIFIASFCSANAADIETRRYDSSKLKRMRIKNSVGNIDVLKTEGNQFSAILRKEKSEKCSVRENNNPYAYQLEVKEKNKSFWGSSQCKVDVVLNVPEDVSIELSTLAGDIAVAGLKKDAVVRTESGDIRIDSAFKKLNVVSNSGDLVLRKPSRQSRLHNVSGDIKLELQNMPQKGNMAITIVSGNVEMNLPAKAKVNSRLQIGSGSLIDEVGKTRDSKFKLSVKAGTGDIALKKKY